MFNVKIDVQLYGVINANKKNKKTKPKKSVATFSDAFKNCALCFCNKSFFLLCVHTERTRYERARSRINTNM